MDEVRAGVDAVDEELARLIGVRFRYMDAAARIKQERAAVRDEARKAEVIANAAIGAARHDWPAHLAAKLWQELVKASIAYEFEAFDRLRS